MTLGNMRALGVQRLVVYCLNPSCRHQGLTKYPGGYRSAVVRSQGRVWQVRRARPTH